MRLTQRTAMAMFAERGFDQVTVGEIAAAVEMAASTLYRHFATKEAIVLWDEHEAALDTALERELARQHPFDALRKVFVEEIGNRYDADLAFHLHRVQYIYATEQLHGAAIEADLDDRDELADALSSYVSSDSATAAPILAGAAMLALDIAFDRWQQLDGKQPLSELIDSAFENLSHLQLLR